MLRDSNASGRINSPASADPGRSEQIPRVLGRKVLLLMLLPPLLVTVVSVILVQVEVGKRMRGHIQEQLETAASVWNDLYEARGQDLATQAWVVARDPKFFALLAQSSVTDEVSYHATLQSLGKEFRQALRSDYYEVLDESGKLLVRGGDPGVRGLDLSSEPEVSAAMHGDMVVGATTRGERIFQVATVPVVVRGQLVGILRHGKELDASLAHHLRQITHCEATFLLESRTVATSRVSSEGDFLSLERSISNAAGGALATIRLERSTRPEAEFLGAIRATLFVIGMFVLAASLILTIRFTKQLTQPVDQLVDAAWRLEQGDEDRPILIRSGDELEYLGRRFEEMRGALRRQIQSLEELDKMKSNFLTLASHELRTPTTVISGARFILEDLGPDASAESVHEILPMLDNGIHRLENVVAQITDMSLLDRKKMSLKMGPVDLRQICSSLRETWEAKISERGLAFTLALPEESLLVWADGPRISQAIENLIKNAARFTERGSVVLEASIAEGTVRIAILDTGIGVPEEAREHIFDPFHEGKDILSHSSGDANFGSSGLGIGLAISRSIVQGHEGTIWFEPREESGSKFVIELPSIADRLESPATGSGTFDERSAA